MDELERCLLCFLRWLHTYWCWVWGQCQRHGW